MGLGDVYKRQDLLNITHQERRSKAAAAKAAEHHAQAAEGLGAACRYARGSAVEDAFLDHASEARALRQLSSL